MTGEKLNASLGPESQRRVIYADIVDSTNARAIAAVVAGSAGPGDVFVAGRQTAGRGSGGKRWESPEPLGLWATFIVADPPPAAPLALLPAVAVARVLQRDYDVPAHVKWPNDVLVGTGDLARKIAGILIEAVTSPAGRAWAMGIGINVNQKRFDGELAPIATSLRMQLGRETSIVELFGLLAAELDVLENENVNLPTIWTNLSRMPGRTIRLMRGGRVEIATVSGIDADGWLQIIRPDGTLETLVSVTGLDIDRRY